MAYTTPTLTEAITALSVRLQDSSNTRWVSAELETYIGEALRTWNAYTNYFRDQGSFTTSMGTVFYQLPSVLAALRAPTITTYNVIAQIQYMLLEPATPSAWSGTDQFTLDQINAALERRRNLFLLETGIQLDAPAATSYASPAADGKETLNQTVVQIRRAVWTPDATLIPTVLRRSDTWGANHYSTSWTTAAVTPKAYALSATLPLEIQIIPPAASAGSLSLVQVTRGAAFTSGTDTLIGVPDDWVWVIRWGALADLLGQDGLAFDPIRAAYCEARWNQGLAAARMASVVLGAYVDGAPVQISALSSTDAYSPYWQAVPGIPRGVLTMGHTLVATVPPAGAKAAGGDWTIALDVVENTPVPANGGDPLGIGPELFDPILDYAQHLALFKDGPQSLQGAQALLDRFMQAAGVTLTQQQAQQPARAPLLAQTTTSEGTQPRELPVVDVSR